MQPRQSTRSTPRVQASSPAEDEDLRMRQCSGMSPEDDVFPARFIFRCVDVTLGPAPSDETMVASMPTWDYRVVFWQHQLPPEASGIAAEDMGWAELTFTLSDVQDVHEAIEWAERNIDVELDKDGSGPHGERLYVLYAKVPRPYGGTDWFVQIAGWDPTSAGENLERRHPQTIR